MSDEREYWETAKADPIIGPLLDAGVVREPNDRLLDILSAAINDYQVPVYSPQMAGVLTTETLKAAIEKVNEMEIHLCGQNDFHIFHPQEMQRGGWARCANCFGWYDLGPGTDG